MSVFLTPELNPFYGGTYFPPDHRQDRPGFLQLLQHIHQLWETRRDDLVGSAAQVHLQMQQLAGGAETPSGVALSSEALRNAGALFKQFYDPRNGGFGAAPKFPQPSQPQFLLRYGKRFKDSEAVRMVLHTCDRMAAGGIHDQLGGGFSRYAVDAEWLVPHFEKMLYDNAQLAQLYLDAWLVSGDARHAAVARDILDYVLRDMTHPDGGFYSAEDADSEGHEGKFYCWTRAELAALLTPEEFNVASGYYGVTEAGNFVDHSHPHPLGGQNVLSVVNPDPAHGDSTLLESAVQKMRQARAKRIRPHRDDKVLASWNGLMLGAFARASAVLPEENYRRAAVKNAAFMQSTLWEPPQLAPSGAPGSGPGAVGTLFHRWREGARDEVQLLEAYAFLLDGVLELYQATLDPEHLGFAIRLADSMIARFYDGENGGFWQSMAGSRDLIVRVKEAYDGAEPSGNSVAILALLKLGSIAGRPDFTVAAEKSLGLFSTRLQQMPQSVPCMLQALDFRSDEPGHVVIAGDPESAVGRELLHVAHSVYRPDLLVVGNTGPVGEFARNLPHPDDATAYLCANNTCQAPTSDADALRALLRKESVAS